MCALTIAPPSSSDPLNDPSWAARAAKLRVNRPPDVRTVPLSFRDLRVTAEDVTTVGEALARCSPQEMLDAVMRHEAGWRIPVDAVGSRAYHMLMMRIGAALEAMRSLQDAAAALMPSREGVVGPLFRFSAAEGGRGFEHRVEAVVLPMDDAAAIEGSLAEGLARVCTWDALRTQRCDAKPAVSFERLAPEALRGSLALLSRMSWERVLALPLWLPRDLSEDERQAVLAKVFWAMTYHGFEQRTMPRSISSTQQGADERPSVRAEPAPWPTDPVMAVLDHNCWVDTLEAWNALFAVISPCETRP